MFLECNCELNDSCVHLFVDSWKVNCNARNVQHKVNCNARNVQHKIAFVISVRGWGN